MTTLGKIYWSVHIILSLLLPGCRGCEETPDKTPPLEKKTGFVCVIEVQRDLASPLLADPIPPGNKLRDACLDRLDIKWDDLLHPIQALNEKGDAIQLPDCVGWVHYSLSDEVNRHSIPLRMKGCNLYTDERVKALGRTGVEEIEKEHGIDWKHERIQYIADRLLSVLKQKGCFRDPMRFGVMNDVLNAHAYMDGTILVGSPFLKESDATIAYLLSHEIMHLQWASFDGVMVAITRSSDTELKKRLSSLYHTTMAFARGPMDEVFVDKHAIILMTRAGYDPTAAPRLINTFGGHDPNSAFRIGETHPPNKMRASLAVHAAKIAMIQELPKNSVLFRGWSGPSDELQWDGSDPDTALSLRCTIEPLNTESEPSRTWCGSSKAEFNKGSPPHDWSAFRCMAKANAKEPERCRVRGDYTDTKAYGCPGQQVCCPD